MHIPRQVSGVLMQFAKTHGKHSCQCDRGNDWSIQCLGQMKHMRSLCRKTHSTCHIHSRSNCSNCYHVSQTLQTHIASNIKEHFFVQQRVRQSFFLENKSKVTKVCTEETADILLLMWRWGMDEGEGIDRQTVRVKSVIYYKKKFLSWETGLLA